MADDDGRRDGDNQRQRVAAGAVLGVGVGSAIGAATGDLGTGI